jgi:hypothetical protein
MRTKVINSARGRNLVFIEDGTLTSGHRNRWVDAWGPVVSKFVSEFDRLSVDDTTGWPTEFTNTIVQGGSGNTTFALVVGAEGGAAIITTDDVDNDGVNMQLKGEAFKLATNKPLYFGIKMTCSEATQSDFLVGLAITDTDALGGLTDGVYFRKVDAATAVTCVIEKDSAETASSTLSTLDTSAHIYEFYYDGAGNVTPYVDGTASTALSGSNLPDDEFLTLTLHLLSGAAGAKTFTIDWVRAIQLN